MPPTPRPWPYGPGEPQQPDEPPGTGRPRRAPRAVIAFSAAALLAGAWLLHNGTQTSQPPAPTAAEAVGSPSPGQGAPASSASPSPTVAPLPYSVPERVKIPSIKVDAPLMKLGVDASNQLQVPPETDKDLAGWYDGGPAPGEKGAAVLAGHVDNLKGPAVFYNLGSLHKGNTVEITRADKRVAVFTVYGVNAYEKKDFPDAKVYADTPTPELRLITCGGGFSKTTRSYLGNVVVYAKLTAVK
ncbi:class F sortase [Streptantibioticus parmotrematis]|uniref:class F sortase n=1 Tax=Streptantibioticus parmotrematis TaxID=2873249 RepID=UPI0033C50048